jgi:hypothetical protein
VEETLGGVAVAAADTRPVSNTLRSDRTDDNAVVVVVAASAVAVRPDGVDGDASGGLPPAAAAAAVAAAVFDLRLAPAPLGSLWVMYGL